MFELCRLLGVAAPSYMVTGTRLDDVLDRFVKDKWNGMLRVRFACATANVKTITRILGTGLQSAARACCSWGT